jgi:hypothetical protein
LASDSRNLCGPDPAAANQAAIKLPDLSQNPKLLGEK